MCQLLCHKNHGLATRSGGETHLQRVRPLPSASSGSHKSIRILSSSPPSFQINRPIHMRKDVIQKRPRRKNANVRDMKIDSNRNHGTLNIKSEGTFVAKDSSQLSLNSYLASQLPSLAYLMNDSVDSATDIFSHQSTQFHSFGNF